MSAGSAVAKEWAPKIGAQGCVVIDNSSCWRYDQDVPLVVPEVNADAVDGFTKKNIIANPNCSTAQLVVALKPLHDWPGSSAWWSRPISRSRAPARRPWTSCGTRPRASSSPHPTEPKAFTKQIAFNVIPHIDVFMEDGSTKEEWKMVVETKKILDPKIKVTATCVRVPVFVGHSEAVNIEFEKPITAERRAESCARRRACWWSISASRAATSRRSNASASTPPLSRIREDPTVENGLYLWIVSDNLRKGAALNTVQIAETIINRKLLDRAA